MCPLFDFRPFHDFGEPLQPREVVDLETAENEFVRVEKSMYQIRLQSLEGQNAVARIVQVTNAGVDGFIESPSAVLIDEINEDNNEETYEEIELAFSLMEELKASLSKETFEDPVALFLQILTKLPNGHPHRPNAMFGYASALGARFLHSNNQSHFLELEKQGKEILGMHETAGDACLPDDEEKLICEAEERAQQSLSKIYQAMSLSNVKTVIYLLQNFLDELPNNHPKRHFGLSTLAYGFYLQFRHTGDMSDLYKSATILRSIAHAGGDEQDQNIDALQQLLSVSAAQLIDKNMLADFRKALSDFSETKGRSLPNHMDDESDVVYAARLCQKFQSSGNVNYLDEGITLLREGLSKTPTSDPEYEIILGNFGVALALRFQKRGEWDDLDSAISTFHQALESKNSDFRSSFLGNLARVLRIRFEIRGDAQDLDDAISSHLQALEFLPLSEPSRSSHLASFASTLKARSILRNNNIHDLNEAIRYNRLALELHPSHVDRSHCLNNLANALTTRYQQLGCDHDLNEAIMLQKQALELILPQDPARFCALAVLGGILQDRFHMAEEPIAQDLDDVISLYRQALALNPPERDANYLKILINLVLALKTRFERGKKIRDLMDCISYQRRLVELHPQNHPARFEELHNLGMFYIFACEQPFERRLAQGHVEQALSCFSEAARSLFQSPSQRFHNAKTWAQCADRYDHPSALEAYDATLDVLPQIAALGNNVQARRKALTVEATDGISRRAARCAIRAGQLEKAVEFLETGRGVFWNQALCFRSSFDHFQDIAPETAKRLKRTSEALEKYSHGEINFDNVNGPRLPLESEVLKFEDLIREWESTLDTVRKLEGFEDFLRPKRLSTLQAAAGKNPVVYLVANADGSDCIILTDTAVHHIPLPYLPAATLFSFARVLDSATMEYRAPNSMYSGILENVPTYMSSNHTPSKTDESEVPLPSSLKFAIDDNIGVVPSFMRSFIALQERRSKVPETSHSEAKAFVGNIAKEGNPRAAVKFKPKEESSDDVFKSVLSTLWEKAVKPVIERLGLKKSSERTPVRWCATGLFAFMPIHAAGCYEEGKVDCASDYIISSYTPNVGAFLARKSDPLVAPSKMMAVIQPQTLPSTRKELEKIEQRIQPASIELIKFGVPGSPASVNEVASHLSKTSIVHFACHGIQDRKNPLDSGLQIGGEMLTISRIMKEKVPNGALAFLSACETAVGDQKIPDEDMSIGASLLFAGFRSVVATMWKIQDSDGPVVADAFYEELFKGPDGNHMQRPDTHRSAQALSIAVEKLRSKGVPFNRWVPFIHMGQ